MQKSMSLGLVLALPLILAGAGCAPQTAQKQAPATQNQVPANQAGTPKTGGSAATSVGGTAAQKTPAEKKLDVTENDLNKLKQDIKALQFEDLSAPKN